MNRYEKHLQSVDWVKTCERIMARAGGVCERSGCKRFARQVHHETYKRLGHERDSDLVALCFPCHQAEHPGKGVGWRSGPKPAEFDCPHCPSIIADIYFGDRHLLFVCRGCGHDARRPWERVKRRGKQSGAKKRRHKTEKKRQCGICGKWLVGEQGVSQHKSAVHKKHQRQESGPHIGRKPIPRNSYREWIKTQ